MADPAPDPNPARRDGLLALAIAGIAAGTILVGALVPGVSVRPPLSPAEDAACAEWSDGCRVCQRLADGPACSMPGIACTRTKPTCLRRIEGR